MNKLKMMEPVCSTCFKAFLLCFCEGEMSLLVGTDGDEHRGCGDEGCDCSLEGTTKRADKRETQNRCHKIHFLGVVRGLYHVLLLFWRN